MFFLSFTKPESSNREFSLTYIPVRIWISQNTARYELMDWIMGVVKQALSPKPYDGE